MVLGVANIEMGADTIVDPLSAAKSVHFKAEYLLPYLGKHTDPMGKYTCIQIRCFESAA